MSGKTGWGAEAPTFASTTLTRVCGRAAQARVLEVGEERDAAAQQAADAEAAVEAARRELEAAVAQRDAQLRQVMEAQQRLAQQLDASESAEQARRSASAVAMCWVAMPRPSELPSVCVALKCCCCTCWNGQHTQLRSK